MNPARLTALAILLLAIFLFAVGGLAEWADRRAAPADAEMAVRVVRLLEADPRLRRQGIVVEAFGDLLVLRGSVPTREARQAAIDLARRVPGVRGVHSEIRVMGEPDPAPRPPDR